ncbi:hypothetical protein [uncultured Thiohalocapsa sp.]|uniref:hypothetical protein n=1 Tax=uncultured Thiohalocapsa sp. TaxID=768990 RepID=UPI0025D0BA26|nr:hypothetical protein [uncultured Thiohalocapsa sp.]
MSCVLNAGLEATGSASVLLRRFLRVCIRGIAMVVGERIGLAALNLDNTPLLSCDCI